MSPDFSRRFRGRASFGRVVYKNTYTMVRSLQLAAVARAFYPHTTIPPRPYLPHPPPPPRVLRHPLRSPCRHPLVVLLPVCITPHAESTMRTLTLWKPFYEIGTRPPPWMAPPAQLPDFANDQARRRLPWRVPVKLRTPASPAGTMKPGARKQGGGQGGRPGAFPSAKTRVPPIPAGAGAHAHPVGGPGGVRLLSAARRAGRLLAPRPCYCRAGGDEY